MDAPSLINSLNISLIFLITILTLLSVTFVSFCMGKKAKKRGGSDPSDFITNNILGLLALILGFSFSLVVDRFEHRRALGMEEVNAIGTAWMRAKVINFKKPEEVRDLYKKYVELRISSHKAGDANEAIHEMVELKAQIWKSFHEVAVKERGELESGYMQALNEMFTTANTRYMAMLKMLPVSFYFIILGMASAALGLMNFDRGFSNDTRHWRTILFILLFGLIFTFIYDLDHSKSGFIQLTDPLLIVRSLLASQ